MNGQTVLAFLDGVPSVFEEKTQGTLETHGIEGPQPDQWYPQQAWLDAFEAVAENVGDSTVRSIGGLVPDNADWPPGVSTVEEGVESIDDAYQMNHRGGEIGHYLVESVGENEATIRCPNPYPCSFDQGILGAVASEFGSGLPSLAEVGDECRDTGAKECVYALTW